MHRQTESSPAGKSKPVTKVPSVVIRFAGDSGDGMQLAGMQFTDTSAMAGNDVRTFPDYPSEIRAPAGTIAGVSGYQIQFSSNDVFTPGDDVDALVAMNPASLKANIKAVKLGGIVIVNEDSFTKNELKKAGYDANPLEDNSLQHFRVIAVPIDKLNALAVKDVGLTPKQVDMCKNFFGLGLVYWLYDRPLNPTLNYIEKKFGKKNPTMALANELTLKAGYSFGESTELFAEQYHVPKASLPPGTYRKLTGNEAMALGLAVSSHLASKDLVYCSYPITPASEILHGLAELKHHRVVTFQAEDEICAMGAAIGAAYGGALAVTGTSGPGMALKTEALGLAVITELPVVIVNVQRGGPSTGLPTKTEQSDLFQAIFGRNGECPIPVIAASSPTDCFDVAIEASRIALKYMTPVIALSDGYVANSSEPWRVPQVSEMAKIEVNHPSAESVPMPFMPYARNEDLARPWALPGTPGLEHRIGGLEKQDLVGCVSHDPLNHEKMVSLRAAKVAGIKPVGAPYLWTGPKSGDVLLVGWGGTYGAIKAATLELQKEGIHVSACQLRYINPMPAELGELMSHFAKVIVPELNMGQLAFVLRAKFLVDTLVISKVRGQPFTVNEIVRGVKQLLIEPEKTEDGKQPEASRGAHVSGPVMVRAVKGDKPNTEACSKSDV